MKIPMRGYGWERHGDGINAPFTLPSPRDKSGVKVVDEAIIFLGHYAHFFEDEYLPVPRKKGCCPHATAEIPMPQELQEQELEAIACHWYLLREMWAPSWHRRWAET